MCISLLFSLFISTDLMYSMFVCRNLTPEKVAGGGVVLVVVDTMERSE